MKGLILLLMMGIFSNGFAQVQSKAFEMLLKSMIKNTVPTISVSELKPKIEKVVLLDAREVNEFNVSHLKNAKNIGFNEVDYKILENVPKGAEIVVYCSIGVRSEKIGERLKEKGYTNVKNLYGSIFEWVNQGQEVYDLNGKPTKKVHAYNKKWGVWLKKGEKVYE